MKPQAAYFLYESVRDLVYAPEDQTRIAARLDVAERIVTPEAYAASEEVWPEVEILLSSWGMARADEAFLRRFPKLKAVFYGAGSVRAFVSEAFWRRGIVLCNAASVNAVPVAEYAFANILIALKQGWRHAWASKQNRALRQLPDVAGAYGSVVGLISLGAIGRKVAEWLGKTDVRILAYDPFVSPSAAAVLGVELVSLQELFSRSHVVSCHAPHLKETEGMIRGVHFASLPPGAAFLNTARGAVVNESEMIRVLRDRPDLSAILDVTHPEPPPPDSPLYDLPNVVLTPHIAGSMGLECRRMGRLIADELDRYLDGHPLQYRLSERDAALSA